VKDGGLRYLAKAYLTPIMSLPPSAGRYSFENLDTLLYVCASSLETSSKVEVWAKLA
jgi:hypothetical protein